MIHLLGLIRQPGWPGVAMAFAAYALCALAMLPAWPITMTLGSIYGIRRGLLIASPASVAAATAIFLLGRSVLRDWARRRIAGSKRIAAISRAVNQQSGWVVFLLRLSPIVPANVLSYALSLTDVPLHVYVAATAAGTLPPTILYLYLGSVTASLARGTVYSRWQTAAYALGLLPAGAAIWLIGRAVRDTLSRDV
jgi:uncharacterized membrane protein YdjX (TVP38/TMEM64 family)